MKEKLRQLFGGDQKQDKTKEVAEQKEQKVREESMEQEKPEVPEEQEELKKEENIDGEENSLDIPDLELCSYTEKQYSEVLHKLENAQQEITELEEKLEDAEDRAWHNDKTATALRGYLEEEEQLRKVAEETAKSAQGAADELERVKAILGTLGTENAAEAAQRLVDELGRTRSVLDNKNEAIASLEARHGNLLRMSKERANADRNLRPKKWHTGYPVIRSTQKKIKNEIVWETLIQTHYHFDLVAEAADEEIQRDLFTEKGLIYNLGITDRYEGPYESMKTEMRRKGKKVDELNVAFSCRLERDFQGKYWKVWVMHTKPLGEIPDDMMLQDN